jgi:methylmalonyl-CoA mutase
MEEKEGQIQTLNSLHLSHQDELDVQLKALKKAAVSNENVFECLMEAAKSCSLGQLTRALYEVGGQYRRNM